MSTQLNRLLDPNANAWNQMHEIQRLLHPDPEEDGELFELKRRVAEIWTRNYISGDPDAIRKTRTYAICVTAKLLAEKDPTYACMVFQKMLKDIAEKGEQSRFDLHNVALHLFDDGASLDIDVIRQIQFNRRQIARETPD